ncbi:MAG: holo-ACP synthase [Rhizobiales bacterium NRL2]|jgi:holo-[acyl-carrier protein] synthase|nr:MAG: holo-ACP synthase [Rhizobiales bacterium NRL2]
MIVGIGADLCDIRRIERSIERFGKRFLDRCFTAGEQAACGDRADTAARFARRYAAKEAAAKALGTGIGEFAGLKEIEVVSRPNGKPDLILSGQAAATLAGLCPAGAAGFAHLSISDEAPYALAYVVLEARPAAADRN